MPGFTTHYVLGMKAYNDMPQNNLKFIIAKYRWLYQLGLQGPDTIISWIFLQATIFFIHSAIRTHNISITPVSYTHLDVYKRQIPLCLQSLL